MVRIYCDPSYTGTGITCIDFNSKTIEMQLHSAPDTKRSVEGYFLALEKISLLFQNGIETLLDRYKKDEIEFYLEAPVVSSFSSPGLYALQMEYLRVLKILVSKLGLTKFELISLPPSFIKPRVKKLMKGDNTSVRKNLAKVIIHNLCTEGFTFVKDSIPLCLEHSGCDVATSLEFYYFLDREKTYTGLRRLSVFN